MNELDVLLKARVFCDCGAELSFPFSAHPVTNPHDIEALNRMFEREVHSDRVVQCNVCRKKYVWCTILLQIQDTCHALSWGRTHIQARWQKLLLEQQEDQLRSQ